MLNFSFFPLFPQCLTISLREFSDFFAVLHSSYGLSDLPDLTLNFDGSPDFNAVPFRHHLQPQQVPALDPTRDRRAGTRERLRTRVGHNYGGDS